MIERKKERKKKEGRLKDEKKSKWHQASGIFRAGQLAIE